MRSSHFVRFFTCIASCLSVARAFSVTVGTPTQCDGLTVSWTGGQAPFVILLTPSLQPFQNITVPASAFSNGKGSYSISPLTFAAGTLFVLTMSDATGFGTGGTTNQLTVGSPVGNNDCDTQVLSPPYLFYLSPQQLMQCGQFTLDYTGAILPATIGQLIPGGQPTVFNSGNSNTLTLVANVNAGTNLVFFVTDSVGRQGGVSGFEQVLTSNNASCLNANSPSSTSSMAATATASSSSTSSPSSSSSSNTAVIAGAAGGGAAVLVALVILGICLLRKRRASRSSNRDSDIAPQFPFPYKTNSINYHTQPIQRGMKTQSDMTSSSAGNYAIGVPPTSFSHTQHSRQSSNTDFPGYGDTRSSTTMSSAYNRMAAVTQPTSQHYPSPYPISYLSPPIQPGSQSPPSTASTGNFTVSGHPTLHSRQSSNVDSVVYGDARSSAMSSVDRRMATVAETSPLLWETDHVSYPGPPTQSESQSTPVNASAGNFSARDVPAPFNQTQPSESHKNSSASGSQSMASAGAHTAATAPGQTDYQTPARILVHTDAEDVVPDNNGLVELPPQYSEHRGRAS